MKTRINVSITVAVALVALAISALTASAQVDRDGGWRMYADPAEDGFSPAQLAQARTFSEQIGSTAVMLIHHGRVVVAWGDIERSLECASTRKSLLSALYGIAVARGQIDLSTTIARLGIDDDRPLTDTEKQATIRDLISSRSGIYLPAAKETEGNKRKRPARGSHAPGTFWYYNNWDFNVAGVIYEQLTGMSIGEGFMREIAGPIGMQDFTPAAVITQYEPSNSRWPAYDVRMSARDFARFGQLFLQNGRWGERQIVPADWVHESTARISRVDALADYGYMWWNFSAKFEPAAAGDSAFWKQEMYSAEGNGGHLILIIPEADMVFVHRGDNDYQRMVNDPDIWKLVQQLWSARSGREVGQPHLKELAATAYAYAKPSPPQFTAVPVDAEVLEQVAGVYRLDAAVTLTIRPWNGRLIGTTSNGNETELFPSSADHYFAPALNIEFTVERDNTGKVLGLNGTMFGRPMVAHRID